MSLIGSDQLPVGGRKILSKQHRLGAASQQFGTVGAQLVGQQIEPTNEVVVELYEYLATSHVHMVFHMVCEQSYLSNRWRSSTSSDEGSPSLHGSDVITRS